MGTEDYAWVPTGYYAESSNIVRFMDEYGYDNYDDLTPDSEASLARFWGDVVEDVGIVWREPSDQVVDLSDGNAFSHWFPGGRLNATETILDRWAERTPERSMYVWENEAGETQSVTYGDVKRQTDRLANALMNHGIGRGDVVAITVPLHPIGFVASLAVMRIGATFTQIFPGYGAEAMAHRFDDAGASLVLTVDGYTRNGSVSPLLEKVGTAAAATSAVETIVASDHVGIDVAVEETPVTSWEAFVADSSAETSVEVVPSDHPAFIAYSSGTTGRPKGTIHTHASLLAMGNKEGKYHYDLGEGDVLLWATDFGWIIVPIWLLAGGPALGATVVLLEGNPLHPSPDRIWRTVEQYGVTTFGISPTGARGLREHRPTPRDEFDLRSIRILGSTGEPWASEDWLWLFEAVGGNAPIINASGGTELAGALLSPTPAVPLKPGTLYGPAPGVAANIFDSEGRPASEGYLVAELPIPGMTHGLTSGDGRYLEEYWTDFDGVWNQHDLARRDDDGFWFVTGRADDTMNVAGRRVTAPAIEAAILSHPGVAEATVVPIPDDARGQAPIAFVTTSDDDSIDHEELEAAIVDRVADDLGSPFRPVAVHVVPAIPRTQTGKIPRAVISDVYLGEEPDNLASLDDGGVLETYPRRGDHDRP